MKTTIKRKNQLQTSQWSGGSTTELFIFPHESSYQRRDFSFRISSATVTQSPSEFTFLGGYQRILMPLDSPLRLVFGKQKEVVLDQSQKADFARQTESVISPFQAVSDKQKEVVLDPFDSVKFDGSDKTISHGICTDIGVMFLPAYSATLETAKGSVYNCQKGFTCFYALCDNVIINENTLMQGDFLIIESDCKKDISIVLPAENSAVMIAVSPLKEKK